MLSSAAAASSSCSSSALSAAASSPASSAAEEQKVSANVIDIFAETDKRCSAASHGGKVQGQTGEEKHTRSLRSTNSKW